MSFDNCPSCIKGIGKPDYNYGPSGIIESVYIKCDYCGKKTKGADKIGQAWSLFTAGEFDDNHDNSLILASNKIEEVKNIINSSTKIQEDMKKEISKLEKEVEFLKSERLVLLGKFTKADREKYDIK